MWTSDSRSRFGFAPAAVAGVFCLVVLSLSAPGRAVADEPNHAGIVVSFDDGRSNALCIEFQEPEISGADLLRRAGFPVVVASGSDGAAVCSIGGTGCQDPGDCFCQCHGSGCHYWAYYTLESGAWQYSAVGSSTRKVHNGDVDGWAWGSGSIGSGAKPEVRTFEKICGAPAPPTPTSPSGPASTAQPDAASPAAGEIPPAVTGTPTPEFYLRPGATFPPGLAQLGKLPTALARWQGEEQDSDSGSGLRWEIPVFAVAAVVLLGVALMLAKRRADGERG